MQELQSVNKKQLIQVPVDRRCSLAALAFGLLTLDACQQQIIRTQGQYEELKEILQIAADQLQAQLVESSSPRKSGITMTTLALLITGKLVSTRSIKQSLRPEG